MNEIKHAYADDPTIAIEQIAGVTHVYQHGQHIGYTVYQEHPAQGYVTAIKLPSEHFVEVTPVVYMPEDGINLVIERYREDIAQRLARASTQERQLIVLRQVSA